MKTAFLAVLLMVASASSVSAKRVIAYPSASGITSPLPTSLPTSLSCPPPPSSLEVCLTSIFSTLETALTSIYRSIASYETSIVTNMHHEHTLLTSEVSWISHVSAIASSVKSAVSLEYTNLYQQIYNLKKEKLEIQYAYSKFMAEYFNLKQQVLQIQKNEEAIYAKYKSIYYAKWSVYSYISAIMYEKQVISVEIVEIEAVVSKLNFQVVEIYSKISQLYHRQEWLSQWEKKLYVELVSFEKYVKQFKYLQKYIKLEEVAILAEQLRLYEEVEVVQQQVVVIKQEYVELAEYLKALLVYEKKIEYLYEYVSRNAEVFISYYSKFTCEDSLLYYEACSSKHPVAVAPPPTR